MSPRASPRLVAGLLTLALWALVAGSALFWWLRAGQLAAPLQAPLAGGPTVAATVDSTQVARALGATPAAQAVASAAPDVAGRLALRGVVTHGGRGAALISVDGKLARPVRVGAPVDGLEGDWRLRSVAPRAVVLVAGGRELRLEMPPLALRSSAGDAVMQGGPPTPPGQLGGMPLPPPVSLPPATTMSAGGVPTPFVPPSASINN